MGKEVLLLLLLYRQFLTAYRTCIVRFSLLDPYSDIFQFQFLSPQHLAMEKVTRSSAFIRLLIYLCMFACMIIHSGKLTALIGSCGRLSQITCNVSLSSVIDIGWSL